ncbi:MAG: substrate-binding domain-containing protein [Lentisphaeria bacterium]|nr:substrate-binding domain-containing protein [Lentisphaeria bacterium]
MESNIDYRKLNPDRKSGEPLHLQLHHSLVREIRSLPPNRHVALMSERELALQLKLSRRTTHRAYEQLINDHLVRRMPDKSLVVRSDARTRITGAYPVIGVLIAMDFVRLMEQNDRSILPYLEGLIGRSSQRKISCIMLRAPDPSASPDEIEAFAAEHFPRLCGVVHLGGLGENPTGDPVLEQILRHTEIPQVCISGSVPNANTGSVYADPAAGLDELCRTLKERGCRSAGVIGNQFFTRIFHYVASDRPDAMQEALKRNGLECRYLLRTRRSTFREQITAILTAPDRPDVLLCHDDRMAHQVMEEAARLGIAVPDDLALAGYDCKQDDSFLASIFTDPRRIAENAVDMVMEHFENGISEKNRIKVLATSFSDGPSIRRKK